jgi:hypothetical protein
MSDINNEAKQGSMEVFFNGLVKENDLNSFELSFSVL